MDDVTIYEPVSGYDYPDDFYDDTEHYDDEEEDYPRGDCE